MGNQVNLVPGERRKSGPVNLVQLSRKSMDSGFSTFPASPRTVPFSPLSPVNTDRPSTSKKPVFAPRPGPTEVVQINVRRTLRRPAKLNWKESAQFQHASTTRESDQNLVFPTPETTPATKKPAYLFRTMSSPEGNETPILRKSVKRYKLARTTSTRVISNDVDMTGNKPMENAETPGSSSSHTGKPVPSPSSLTVGSPGSIFSYFHLGKSTGNGQEDDTVTFSRQPSVRESALFAETPVSKEKIHDQNHRIQIVVQEPPPLKPSKRMSIIMRSNLTKEL